MGRYLAWLAAERELAFATYDDAWRWSVDDPGAFWQSVWDHFDVRSATAPGPALADARMPGARWFPGATLNYAEHVLRDAGTSPATDPVVLARSQTRGPVDLTADRAARRRSARCRAGLRPARACGAATGSPPSCPNIPETLVAFLATASLGAIWSSCAPEFGTRAVVDRFAQIEPTVLLAVDGYRYGDKAIDRAAEVGEIRAALPSLRATCVVPYLDRRRGRRDATRPSRGPTLLADAGAARVRRRSRSTTRCTCSTRRAPPGCPSRSSTVTAASSLEHLKTLALHPDLGPGDRFFWFTTTGWMMWNYLVVRACWSARRSCCSTATRPSRTSARCGGWPPRRGRPTSGRRRPFLHGLPEGRAAPGRDRTSTCRRCAASGSTGAPLPADGFRWVSRRGRRTRSRSAPFSGGTDLCTGVRRRRRRWCRCGRARSAAGCWARRVEAFDEAGRPVIGRRASW